MNRQIRNWLSFMPAVLVAAGIAVVSLWENPQVPQQMPLNDKWLHGLMYVVLAVATMSAVVYTRRTRAIWYIVVCLLVTFYGAIMEILQRFCTLSRSGEMADLYADFAGSLVGVLIVAFIINHKS